MGGRRLLNMSTKTQVATDVDYERSGKQNGYLQVPHSHNDSAWGNILIPITVVKNGSGPTLLAVGGVHGDEFEGPVALMKLARNLKAEQIEGRVIVIPALNLPAVRAGTRLSPIDGVNLNRAFPGLYDDSVTGLIAHYVTNFLFPLADVVLDIHSGGRSLKFIPCVHLHRIADREQFRKMLAAATAWGAPYILLYADVAGAGLLAGESERMGKIVVGLEMGGAGECNPGMLRIAENGIRNVMIQQSLMKGEFDPPLRKIPVLAATQREDYHFSHADGIYESFFEVGDEIEKGEQLGQLHFPETYDGKPEPVVAQATGILTCRRFPGLSRHGDCLAVIAQAAETQLGLVD
jgi:predicted deacylase